MITVIVLVLALAVPGLSAMNAEARLTAATQSVNGVLARAYYLSVAEVNMTAVRFLPAAWDAGEEAERTSGRQHIGVYRYVGTSAGDPNSPNIVQYEEYFQRAEGISPAPLPDDVWVAPLETVWGDPNTANGAPASVRRERLGGGFYPALTYGNVGAQFLLDGQVGRFQHDAGVNNGVGANDGANALLNADDFLIVYDAKSGLMGTVPQPFRLKAHSPQLGYETDRDTSTAQVYQRYNSAGVVIYRREPFVTLGPAASGVDRQAYLRERGRPFMAHRYGGGLVRTGVR